MIDESRYGNTPFDNVFRTLHEKCRSLLIPVINKFFGKNYSMDSVVRVYTNEHYFTDEQGKRQERITDSYLDIAGERYHIECESKTGSYIAVRMAEYDFHIAMSNVKKLKTFHKQQEVQYEMEFPKSAVLYLRSGSNTAKSLGVRMILPDGSQAVYQIPAICLQEYSREDILRKKLLFFLPFYILNYEKDLRQIDASQEQLRALVEDYREIYRCLCEFEQNQIIDGRTLYNLIQLIDELVEYVARNAGNVKREVEVMGGKVLELKIDKIIMEATERGIEHGELVKLISLIRKKWLKGKTAAEAAEALEEDRGTVEDIYALLEQYPDKDEQALYEEYRNRNGATNLDNPSSNKV